MPFRVGGIRNKVYLGVGGGVFAQIKHMVRFL